MANLFITNEFFLSAFKHEQISTSLKNKNPSTPFPSMIILSKRIVCSLLHTLPSHPHPPSMETTLTEVTKIKRTISVFPWFPRHLTHLFWSFLFAHSILTFFTESTLYLPFKHWYALIFGLKIPLFYYLYTLFLHDFNLSDVTIPKFLFPSKKFLLCSKLLLHIFIQIFHRHLKRNMSKT